MSFVEVLIWSEWLASNHPSNLTVNIAWLKPEQRNPPLCFSLCTKEATLVHRIPGHDGHYSTVTPTAATAHGIRAATAAGQRIPPKRDASNHWSAVSHWHVLLLSQETDCAFQGVWCVAMAYKQGCHGCAVVVPVVPE